MSLKYKFTDLILNPIYKIWAWIWGRLDCEFKRMCVMASLHAVLLKCDGSDPEKIKQMNDSLKLVRDVNALKLPTLFGPMLWKKVLPINKMDVSSDKCIQRIIRMTPCWLRYTDETEFREDLRELLQYCNRKYNFS